MTESMWLACQDPRRMLPFVGSPADFRRFAAACACPTRPDDATTRPIYAWSWADVLDVADRMADGTATPQEVEALVEKMNRWGGGKSWRGCEHESDEFRVQHRLVADPFRREHAEDMLRWAARGRNGELSPRRLGVAADFLRDIIGNPFEPVEADPSWFTSTVAALAEGIYQDRAFDRLPVLADALQDADCRCDEILNHLRGTGRHCRGCWVVDLLTGRG